MTTTVTLFLPGLTSSLLKESVNSKLDALSTLLSKGQRLNGPTTIENSIKTFFSGLPNGQIPAGALGALGHGIIEKNDKSIWCRADPVECMVDHQSAYLLGNLNLTLSKEEVTALIAQLNQLLHQDSFDLKPGSANEWFCKIAHHEDVIMNDLTEVLNKNIANLLPSGPDAIFWHRLMTECQMIVSPSKVNEFRATHGQSLVSSIWFWGMGALPHHIQSSFDTIFSNDATIRGLCICANRPCEEIPHVLSEQMKTKILNGNTLIIDLYFYHLLKHQMHDQWLQYLYNYEISWFTPLLIMLKEKQIDRLHLICADGQAFMISTSHLKFFWRKLKPIQQFAKIHNNESSQ
jgi:hypothetical protein